VTQTSPQSSERLTSRQRRIEEQRRKIEVARSQQRRKRMVWGAGIVVVVAAALVVVWLMMPRGVAAQMRQVTTEAGNHVDEGAPLSFSHRPPSSGVHYGTLPQPQEYRMYDTPLNPGRWVHMLEHGAVVVLYRSDLCDSACVQQLGAFYDSAPRSSLVGVRHLAITPYQDMDHAVAVVAWGYIDEMDQVDPDRIMADFKSKVDASSAPERGAM
jgi:Protein of unknown function (DUF3105)